MDAQLTVFASMLLMRILMGFASPPEAFTERPMRTDAARLANLVANLAERDDFVAVHCLLSISKHALQGFEFHFSTLVRTYELVDSFVEFCDFLLLLLYAKLIGSCLEVILPF